ncbi:MAG: B-box zinc finger protein [Acidobacteria bacterium]|nr:B-box zinc finger protein [Acidobacteriota bacterium]
MNCAYHSYQAATVSCNSCGRPLCPACDHRIKGFPYCQDCIVMGVDLLRQQSRSNNAPYVKNRTSPIVATLLSMICPGLGAAYNGQIVKALVYFGVFVGLFQMAVLTSGMPLFVFGFMGMWLFASLDSWRTAQMIRSGVTPDVADDILVKRFSGNPKLWGVVLATLGVGFIFQRLFNAPLFMRALLPIMLIGLGIYVIRGYVRKPKAESAAWASNAPAASFALRQSGQHDVYRNTSDFSDRSRSGSWKDI